jgi:hypothetical protein
VFGRSGYRTRCLVDTDDAILIHHDFDHDIAGVTTTPVAEHYVSWLELAPRELSPICIAGGGQPGWWSTRMNAVE